MPVEQEATPRRDDEDVCHARQEAGVGWQAEQIALDDVRIDHDRVRLVAVTAHDVGRDEAAAAGHEQPEGGGVEAGQGWATHG